MSIPHHNPEQEENTRRLLDEIMGVAERKWPQGRISGDDDGVTAFAVATDIRSRIIRIQFTKPMNWLGLDLESAKKFRDLMSAKITELEAALAPKKS